MSDTIQTTKNKQDTSTQENKSTRHFWNRNPVLHVRESVWLNILFTILVPLLTIFTLEWIARGSFAPNNQGNGFFQALGNHLPSFLIAYLLLLLGYIIISQLSGWHALATGVVGLVGNIPAVVTYYKLTMRGEPFLPWDLTQIGDLMGVKDSVQLAIQPNMILTLLLFVVLTFLAAFVRFPRKANGKPDWKVRLITAGAAFVVGLVLLFGIFLSPKGTLRMGIKEDMWMQDRYYRNHGVITGFLTNLQVLNFSEPEGYSADAVQAISDEAQAKAGEDLPYYSSTLALNAGETTQTPDIIYLMAESFWDVTRLPNITYDQPLLTNLNALKEEAAFGYAYSPSFGGGTCDVEFEALTGFSMEHLPSGSKPYQQYVTQDTFSLPWVLKSKGYDTLAIHGYGRRFWNRDTAYPRLGIDEFIASDNFVNPDKRRGFISDNAMVDRIIQEYEQRKNNDAGIFIHAITMQNHTTYNRDKYPADELVRVTDAPASLSDSTLGQLEDCATGIREMDAALGKLVAYLRTTGRPTILVFWGDHLNPMSDGYKLFEDTGFIQKGDTADPILHELPLLMWSNYATEQIDLGVLATYNISPVMMDLYGVEKPELFNFLIEQMNTLHARTRGVTVTPDNTFSPDLTQAQQETFNQHDILQYDFLFGNRTLNEYVPPDENTG